MNETATPNPLVTALQACGYRLTRQRQVVLEVLGESREHLDAEALYVRARERFPHISLATVYRTVAVLKRMGLVAEYPLGEEHGHYEAVQETPHYHFTCLRCGRVIEFDAPQIAQIAQDMALREGLQIHTVQFSLTGHCNQCHFKEENGR